ncbi:hypothetical protein QAD02_024143, partial [Eretmocerus hayati]
WKTIACSVLCCGCGSVPTSAANLEAGGSISEYQRDKEAARSQACLPTDPSIALTLHRPLYPPGRIIHVVRHHPNKGEQMLGKREPVYQALWAGPCDFDEVLISPVMIQDHMPDNMLRALNKVWEDRAISAELNAITADAIAKVAQSPKTTTGPTQTLDVAALETTTVATLEHVAETVTDPRSSRATDWSCPSILLQQGFGPPRLAPLATPETMSEASSSSSCGGSSRSSSSEKLQLSSGGSPGILMRHQGLVAAAARRKRPLTMMRRTPKIPGNLANAADDLRSNLHFAAMHSKDCYLEQGQTGPGQCCSSSAGSSGTTSLGGSPRPRMSTQPPVPPQRLDSVLLQRAGLYSCPRGERVCTAACCRDDFSDNSSPHSLCRGSRTSQQRVRIDFPEVLDEPPAAASTPSQPLPDVSKPSTLGRGLPHLPVLRQTEPKRLELKGLKDLMAPATDAGAEWRRNDSTTSAPGQVPIGQHRRLLGRGAPDVSLPLLRGLNPGPGPPGTAATVPGLASQQQHGSPFAAAKRKKYVYPITRVAHGESSV